MAEMESVSKVKHLLSSFLSSFGQSMKDSTSYRSEPDGKIRSKISERHTDGERDVSVARNRSLFYERVESFTTFTWFAKPLDLCPLVCAKYGWTNVDSDMLQCVGCKVFLCGKLPKSVETQHYRDCCNKLRNCLIKSHEKLCKWPTNPSPDIFLHVPYHNREDILNGFWSRALSLGSCTLPSLDYKSFAEKNVSEGMAHDLVTRIQKIAGIQEDISTAVRVVALSGWSLCETESGILQCSYCRRKVGLWNFNKDNNNSDSEIHSDSMHNLNYLMAKKSNFCMQRCTEISNETYTDKKENTNQNNNSANSHSPDADGDTLECIEGNIEQNCELGISHLKDKERERESYHLEGKQCEREYFQLKEKESENKSCAMMEKESETESCQLEEKESETESCQLEEKESETESCHMTEIESELKESETESCDIKEKESETESCHMTEKESETECCHMTEKGSELKESETESCDIKEKESETESCHMTDKESETESCHMTEKESELKESETESCDIKEKESETESCHMTEKESETESCHMTEKESETEIIHPNNSNCEIGMNSVRVNQTRVILVNGDCKRPADQGDCNNDPQKKRPRLEKQNFDPLAEHRYWCPWMQNVSALSVHKLRTSLWTSPSSSPLKSVTPDKTQFDASVDLHMSSANGLAADETIPAWLLVAKILRSQDQDDICGQVKMSPQIEGLRQLRKVMRECMSPTMPEVQKTP